MKQFHIDYSKASPAYQQIADQIVGLVTQGTLAPGDCLPTIHELAAQADVNPNTVVRAFQELEKLGIVEGRPGRGTFLRQPAPPATAQLRTKKLQEIYALAMREAFLTGLRADEVMHFFKQQAAVGR